MRFGAPRPLGESLVVGPLRERSRSLSMTWSSSLILHNGNKAPTRSKCHPQSR